MIHVFHGFLGSPHDFAFLKGESVKIYDLYQMDEFPVVSPGDTLIGYSLGGRIALEIAEKANFKIKKLYLLNAHPGLANHKEQELRKVWEDSVLQDLKKKNKEEFLKDWNKLPVFLFDKPLNDVDDFRFNKSPELFNRFRLSNQTNFLPKICEHKDKIEYIIGTLDEKYMDLARDFETFGISVKYIEAGHRLFQHPEKLIELLK